MSVRLRLPRLSIRRRLFRQDLKPEGRYAVSFHGMAHVSWPFLCLGATEMEFEVRVPCRYSSTESPLYITATESRRAAQANALAYQRVHQTSYADHSSRWRTWSRFCGIACEFIDTLLAEEPLQVLYGEPFPIQVFLNIGRKLR